MAIDAFAQGHAARSAAEAVPLGVTRIGVDTGPAEVGNFGGRDRLDYTVYGDVINTAARLESANRQFGTRLCATDRALVAAGIAGWRRIGRVRFAGKGHEVEVLTPPYGDAAAYAAAYERLAAGEPEAARAWLEAILARDPADDLSRFQLARIARGERGTALGLTEK